jgi:multidrug efflux pump
MAKVYENPVFQMADVDLKFSKPEVRVAINRDKANIMGVSTRNIAQVLQYGLSGQRMGYFYMNGKQYEILGEINRQQRNTPANLKSIYIRTDKGDMVQMDNLVDLIGGIAPPKLYRYNRFVSATVSAGLAKGKTIGQGLDEMDKIAAEVLDDSFRTALSGESKEYRESSSSLMFAFMLAIVLIYLILAAQFESFKDPLIIMLTVPLAIAGALVFMYCSGVTMPCTGIWLRKTRFSGDDTVTRVIRSGLAAFVFLHPETPKRSPAKTTPTVTAVNFFIPNPLAFAILTQKTK